MAENTEQFAQRVWLNIVQPDQEHRVESLTRWRWRWQKMSNWFESISVVLSLIGAIVAYAAGVYTSSTLAFSAGTISTTGIAMLQFSKYGAKESLERQRDLRRLLQDIKRGPAALDDPVANEAAASSTVETSESE
jgi:hypothetical protein